MNKKQLAAAMLLGATMGVGGEKAISALNSPVEAAPLGVYTHAVDLRRPNAQGATGLVVPLVYGSREVRDGGFSDIGQAKSCKPAAQTQKLMADTMNALGRDCDW